MLLTLIGKDSANTISLPLKARGQFWLCTSADSDCEKLICAEEFHNSWILKSNRNVSIIDDEGKPRRSVVLEELRIYTLKSNQGKSFCVFTEPVSEDRQRFEKYIIPDGMRLTIGRSEKNDIVYSNQFVSAEHAVLSYSAGRWHIHDANSANGTFVNDKRVWCADLSIGDNIFIMGLKIIAGRDFIAVNNPDGHMKIRNRGIIKLVSQRVKTVNEDEEEYELSEPEYFYRSPRFKRDVERVVFKIDSPPPGPSEEMPWILVMGSSLAMGAMSLVTLVSAAAASNITSIAMGLSMLTGTVLLPVITKRYERKRRCKKEQLRQERYRDYLDGIKRKIDEACRIQEEILNENHVTIQECEERIIHIKRNLWERHFGQNDFLGLRAGYGDGRLDAQFLYSERRFSLEDDDLQEELYRVCEEPKILKNIPITLSLFEDYISGTVGERKQNIEFAKGLIFQIAAFYSYDEVKLVFIYDEAEYGDFDFARWLPHVWNDDKSFRFIASNAKEAKELSAYLEKVAEQRFELNTGEIEDIVPYYVIFSFSRKLASKVDAIKLILSKKENIHISFVAVYDELKNLPKECSMVVGLGEGTGRLFNKSDVLGRFTSFVPDIYLTENPLELSVRLANIPLDISGTGSRLPEMVTFLRMFGVGKAEHLNVLTRWKENNPVRSLETEIGVDISGEVFKLDLHEKFHGPHGLVAGMTGSGKSEFIITYILSMAVNYHPDEVAFILIDYKGGGMAKSFEKLPHTAGIITNLDGTEIKRSMVSIESELKRRQSIFAKAGEMIGVSNIDIYKYQRLYREGKVSEPLQHLFIISDEFAELKTRQPEFMSQLVSAARIGRSLGVHLILATQKPGGVVDDQIWSNSRFRVCLKVQERSDSMDMLKRADAAELKDTGRFYLQVGYNELFEMGQSAWAGAPYYPSDRVAAERDDSVSVIDGNGHVIRQVKTDTRYTKFINVRKQIDVVTDYLCKIADEENIKIRQLWLEPVPEIILINDIRKKYAVEASEKFILNPVVGEYDIPARQQQCVLRLPISREGNVIIYGIAGSGKTSFLNIMIYSIIHEHSAEEVNIYILDFASETLCAFSKAPHVGDVILSHESEKVSNLFKKLKFEMDKRKKLFSGYGGDYLSYVKSSGSPVTSILIVINNFLAFTEIYSDKEEAVAYLSREGTKYGIYFVLTSPLTNGVRFRLLQNFKQILTLQLNDEYDYSTVIGKTDGLFPSKFKGRGLIKLDEIYEFQTASIVGEGNPYLYIQKECLKLRTAWRGKIAEKVPVLPERVDIDFLSEYWNEEKAYLVPIGVECSSLNICYYPFDSHYITMVVSERNEYRKFLNDFIVFAAKKKILDIKIFDIAHAITGDTGDMSVSKSAEQCETGISRLFEIVLYRNNKYKDSTGKNAVLEQFRHLLVLINSLTDLRTVLSDEGRKKLELILERGTADYRIYIVIGEQVQNISGYSFERWYKTQNGQMECIWIGRGICEQYYFKPDRITDEMHEEISSEFGFAIQNRKCTKIKLLRESLEAAIDE